MLTEIATDIANDILQYNVWDSNDLNSPHDKKIKSLTPSLLDEKNPLKQINEADVLVPVYPKGNVDDLIGNTIVVGLYD